jgi:hypothetical protein
MNTRPSNEVPEVVSTPPVSPLPAFRVGPIYADENMTLECAVWANQVARANGLAYTAYNVTIHAGRVDSDGTKEQLKSFPSHHLHLLIDALQECSDWVLIQRTAQAGLAPT